MRRRRNLVEMAAPGKSRITARKSSGPSIVHHRQEGRRPVEVDEVVARTGAFLITPGDVVSEADAGGEVHVHARAEIELVNLVLQHDTLIAGVGSGCIILESLPAAGDRELDVGDGCRIAESFPLPVGGTDILLDPGGGTVLSLDGDAAHGLLELLQVQIVRRRDHLVQFIGILDALIGLDAVDRFLRITALGRDHDDAVGGAGSVDSGRGGVLKDLDGLDVAGVDVAQALGIRKSVHDDQRSAVGRNRAGSSDTDGRGDTDLGGVVVDREAGNLALQRRGHIRHGRVDQAFTADLGDGPRQVRLGLGAVTHHDRVVEQGGVRFHKDGDGSLPGEREFEGTIPDK